MYCGGVTKRMCYFKESQGDFFSPLNHASLSPSLQTFYRPGWDGEQRWNVGAHPYCVEIKQEAALLKNPLRFLTRWLSKDLRARLFLVVTGRRKCTYINLEAHMYI